MCTETFRKFHFLLLKGIYLYIYLSSFFFRILHCKEMPESLYKLNTFNSPGTWGIPPSGFMCLAGTSISN